MELKGQIKKKNGHRFTGTQELHKAVLSAKKEEERGTLKQENNAIGITLAKDNADTRDKGGAQAKVFSM